MKNFLTQFAQKLHVGTGNGQVDVPALTGDVVLQNALNLTYFVAGIAAVIVIIIGGIMYSTSAGEAGSITKAKNMILYAVIGLVIVLAAFAITNFVIGKF